MPNTVLLTGITGFIAKRIAADLLAAGHAVRGTLRSVAREGEVRSAISTIVTSPEAQERLSFATVDLIRDEGWAEAMSDIDVLMHTASPFPMTMPKDEDALVTPAVEGTLRALRAAQAAGVTRVVMTSSVVAIEANHNPGPFSEKHWTDTDHPRATAYYKSKTLAERAAWDFVAKHPEMQLTTINPSLVLGAPLDVHYGTSLALIERILGGKDPLMPNIGFGVVDVSDVSAMHIAAMNQPETAGKRYIASAGSITMPEIARHLAKAHPRSGIATRVAPTFVLKLLSLFDPSIRTVLPALGVTPQFDTTRAQQDMGIAFAPPLVTIDRAAEAVLAKP